MATGAPSWTYLGDIGQETPATYGDNWVFQVAPDQSDAYLITRHGMLFRMNLTTGKATGPLDLAALDTSFKGLQFYGFNAWDTFGRFYFGVFGQPDAKRNSRLVAIDPAQLPLH